MTARLKNAIEKLNADELEQLTAVAESLIQQRPAQASDGDLDLRWVGCMSDSPVKSGVEAAHAANQLRMRLLAKSQSK
jgi:hypothetical protein